MNPRRLLDVATGIALTRLEHVKSRQTFRHAAAAIRGDGVMVASYNGPLIVPNWAHHAETRICRKLTPGSTVAVIRVLADGTWAMSKPCKSCQICMSRVGVKKVYYSIAPNEYGVMSL